MAAADRSCSKPTARGCHGDWAKYRYHNQYAESPLSDPLPAVGQVVPLPEIGTDAARLESYTEALRNNQYRLALRSGGNLRISVKTNGYANSPLDGVWIRGPYLHNGSVPSLFDLFSRPCTPEDLIKLGLDSETDLNQLAQDPQRVGKLIDQARSMRVRPPVFYRGDDQFDQRHVGFRCDRLMG